MSKKFELSEPWDSVPTISCDDVVFIKSIFDSYNGLMIQRANNSALSFSFPFDFSDLTFIKKNIGVESFVAISVSSESVRFEYMFDNDEMLQQFCTFYGLDH